MDNESKIDKISNSISSLIDQIEYLATDIELKDLKKSKNAAFDQTKNKIRSQTDLIWQLSNSLINLIAVKNSLVVEGKKKEKEGVYDLLFKGGARDE